MNYQPIEWLGDRVKILDQTRLPQQEVYLETASHQEVASAITELKIRGAPAIGVAGAYAIALGALGISGGSREDFIGKFKGMSQAIAATRPTARNLFWAVGRMQRVVEAGNDVEQVKKLLVEEAIKIHKEEAEATGKLSQLGAELIMDGSTMMTHCNTGPLATAGYGTALGVIRRAREQGKEIRVFATETRPLLQGARLTAWECLKLGIPVTLITDSMAGYFLGRRDIDGVIVGADRIAANGDTANKIGTCTLAVLAKEKDVPFYVAAPTTTIDPSLATGEEIPIEQRSAGEVTGFHGVRPAPDGIDVANPAFDVTPHKYITAIITERGIIREPFVEGLIKVMKQVV